MFLRGSVAGVGIDGIPPHLANLRIDDCDDRNGERSVDRRWQIALIRLRDRFEPRSNTYAEPAFRRAGFIKYFGEVHTASICGNSRGHTDGFGSRVASDTAERADLEHPPVDGSHIEAHGATTVPRRFNFAE